MPVIGPDGVRWCAAWAAAVHGRGAPVVGGLPLATSVGQVGAVGSEASPRSGPDVPVPGDDESSAPVASSRASARHVVADGVVRRQVQQRDLDVGEHVARHEDAGARAGRGRCAAGACPAWTSDLDGRAAASRARRATAGERGRAVAAMGAGRLPVSGRARGRRRAPRRASRGRWPGRRRTSGAGARARDRRARGPSARASTRRPRASSRAHGSSRRDRPPPGRSPRGRPPGTHRRDRRRRSRSSCTRRSSRRGRPGRPRAGRAGRQPWAWAAIAAKPTMPA